MTRATELMTKDELERAKTICIQSGCPGSVGGDHDGRCPIYIDESECNQIVVTELNSAGAETDSGWSVEVWFATTTDYRTVRSGLTQEEAEREARAYHSDSRGIRIARVNGSRDQIVTIKAVR